MVALRTGDTTAFCQTMTPVTEPGWALTRRPQCYRTRCQSDTQLWRHEHRSDPAPHLMDSLPSHGLFSFSEVQTSQEKAGHHEANLLSKKLTSAQGGSQLSVLTT